MGGENNDASNAAGIFVMFLSIAAAVPIFIVNGMRMNRFEHYDKQIIQLDMQTRADLEQESAYFTRRFITHISVGVTAILLAVGVVIFFGIFGSEVFPVILLLFVIGFAVLLFITAGMNKSAYDVILGKGDHMYKIQNRKAERITETIASVYWPLMTAIFLLWGFVGDAWRICWVIWPVAGVLFGAIAGGIYSWHGNRGE